MPYLLTKIRRWVEFAPQSAFYAIVSVSSGLPNNKIKVAPRDISTSLNSAPFVAALQQA